jgi:site-specific recombinase XerD
MGFPIDCLNLLRKSQRKFEGRLFPASNTPVFEETEIVAFLDSINLESLKDIRDKAIFSVLFYSWCRVSALTNLTVTDY